MIFTRVWSGDDWEGLYANDKLIDQNHSINWWDAFKTACEGNQSTTYPEFVEITIEDQDWWDEWGHLPDSKTDLETRLP